MPENTASRQPLPYLRSWRAHKLMTLEDLAKESQLSLMAIQRLETGKANANPLTVVKLARALGISSAALIYQNPQEQPDTQVAA